MNRNNLYDYLNNTSEPLEARQHVVSYLKGYSERLKAQPNEATTIAYQIAGLMSTDFARSLQDDDPIEEIFTIAGELEVPSGEQESLRQELISAIDRL